MRHDIYLSNGPLNSAYSLT